MEGIIACDQNFLTGYNSSPYYRAPLSTATTADLAQGGVSSLPWPYEAMADDMAFFRKQSLGSIMLMGRKTFDSMGRILDGRLHLILSRQENISTSFKKQPCIIPRFQPGDLGTAASLPALVLPSWQQVNEALAELQRGFPEFCDAPLYLIGGAELFAYAIKHNLLSGFFLTIVEYEFSQDAQWQPVFLPPIMQRAAKTWGKREVQSLHKNEKNQYSAKIYYFSNC